MTLRGQIQRSIAASAALMMVLAAFLAIGYARVAVKREVQSSLALAKQLIDSGLSDSLAAEWPRQFTPIRHLVFEFTDAKGQSSQTFGLAAASNHQKHAPDWFVAWVTDTYPTLRYALTDAEGRALTLLVRANPFDEIDEVWQETVIFFMVLGLLLALMMLVVQGVFKRTLGAIEVIVAALKRMETGDYHARLPEFSIQEYQQIATAIDHLTEVIASKQQENRQLTRQGLKIQEEERRHLAKELHDELGQSLTALRVMTATARQAPEQIQAISQNIDAILEHLLTVTRGLMRQLHPLVLSELGLRAALEDLLAYWSEREPSIDWQLHCADAVVDFPEVTAIHLYRVVQEGVTNIIRHAAARNATISLSQRQDGWRLVIEDDGKGGACLHHHTGFGLRGMQERIQSLNGSLQLTSTARGTQLQVIIPDPPVADR
ncbi:MAG: histidine kinase [Methylococcales bacterium]|nr:histidine kinase [Methylococcales bacterium]